MDAIFTKLTFSELETACEALDARANYYQQQWLPFLEDKETFEANRSHIESLVARMQATSRLAYRANTERLGRYEAEWEDPEEAAA